MKRERFYSAADAAKALGISKQTLVRYEKKKLLPPAKRNHFNNWRVYSKKDIERMLRLVERSMKKDG
jgi:DNA-binding transcriptional MerR regulator